MSAAPDRKSCREQKLRDAISTSRGLSHADFRVYSILLWKADFGTAFLPDPFQPKSLEGLAEWTQVSLAALKRSLGHLEKHGWLVRERVAVGKGGGGRGHRTRYTLEAGASCDCAKQAHDEPVPRPAKAHDEPLNRLTMNRNRAGQPALSAGRAVKGEVVEWGSAEGWRIPWELAAR